MSDELPPMEKIIPAVEHVMASLDHDAGMIQGIADKLVQHAGSSLDQDKATLKQVKNRLSRAITWDVLKNTGPVLTEIGGRMRAAVAVPVEADQQRIDALAARLPPVLPSVQLPAGLPPIPIACPPVAHTVPGPSPPGPDGYHGPCACWDDCYGWVVPGGPYDCSFSDPQCPIYPGSVAAGPVQGAHPPRMIDGWPRSMDGMAWCLTARGWVVANARCFDATCGPGPPGPPLPVPPPVPVPIPSPPWPVPPPIPPVPCPSPVCLPMPAAVPCGQLLRDVPSVAVYVVPWLDPAGAAPSTASECGRKLIADALWAEFPAAEAAQALRTFQGTLDWIGPRPAGPRPSLAGLDYIAPSPGEEPL